MAQAMPILAPLGSLAHFWLTDSAGGLLISFSMVELPLIELAIWTVGNTEIPTYCTVSMLSQVPLRSVYLYSLPVEKSCTRTRWMYML